MNMFTCILQVLHFNSKLTLSILLPIIPLGLVSPVHLAIIILTLKTERHSTIFKCHFHF